MSDAREKIAKILREGAHEYDTTGEGPSDVEAADAILAALSRADIAPKVKPPAETVERMAKAAAFSIRQPNDASQGPEDYWKHTSDSAKHTWRVAISAALVAHGEE